jgi:hypothetical protein
LFVFIAEPVNYPEKVLHLLPRPAPLAGARAGLGQTLLPG